MSTHTYSKEEVYGFTQYVNTNLKGNKKVKQFLPLDPNSEQIFQIISESDGVLLANLILSNAGDKKKIAEKALSPFNVPAFGKKLNIYQSNDNFSKCIKACELIGLKIVNIGASDLKAGKQHLILGMLWQIIRMGLNNKLVHSQHDRQQMENGGDSSKPLDAVANQSEFEQLILQWVNEQTDSTVQNMGKDFSDGTVMLKLMAKLAKDNLIDVPFELEQELQKSPEEKLESALQVCDLLGIERLLRPSDIQSANPKLIFTLMAETFSTSISREMGVGQDMTAQLKPAALGGEMMDNSKLSYFKNCSFVGHFHFDQLRAAGVYDIVEVVAGCGETCKNLADKHSLKINPAIFDDIVYQMMVPGVPLSEIEDQSVKMHAAVRDVIDELVQKPQSAEVQKDLFSLFKSLMIFASDENQRVQLMKTDFSYLIDKISKQKPDISTTLPLLFFLHEMSLVSGNKQFDDLAKQFITNFDVQLKELKDPEEKTALLYIAGQLNMLSKEQLIKYSMSLSTEGLNCKNDVTARTATSMSFVTLGSANPQFAQVEQILKQTLVCMHGMQDENEKSLVEVQYAQLIEQLLLTQPNQTLKFLVDNKIAQNCVQELLQPCELDELCDQRHLLAQSVIAKSIKQALDKGDFTEEGKKSAAEAAKILKSADPNTVLDQTYSNLVENNLGNEILRQAARNTTEALAQMNEKVVDVMADTMEQVAKSSSVTAFLESLSDIEQCKDILLKNPEKLVEVMDCMLACTQKYENNLIVLEKVLHAFTEYAESPMITKSGAFEQIDAFAEDLLQERSIMAQYLQMVEKMLKSGLQVIDEASNSLLTCVHAHSKDEFIMAQWFRTVSFFNYTQAGQFCEETNFFEVAKDTLANFTSNKEVVLSVMKASQALSGACADSCLQAMDCDMFRVMRQYGKFWQKEAQIVDEVVKAHLWAMFYIDGYQLIQGERDVLDELEALM
ncbi:Putative_plastin [Hexamita inflata]|uniref:Plastin n=1 Tax=Hexamita inflata TaxID=28002 RepID=A0AA86VSR8_9EUKA|nr:Putative plastin [Hexamita inflata]